VPGAITGAKDDVNYSVGFELGRNLDRLKRQGTDLRLEAVLRGMLDALAGAEPLISEAEIRKQLDGLKDAPAAPGQSGPREPPDATGQARARGFVDDFAALNAKRDGVITLPSGLQYEVLRGGTGRTPRPSDRVAVHYEGRLATGVVFDTTYKDAEPMRLRIDAVAVPGLREALLRMKEGDKWRVVVPPTLGFGRMGNNLLRKRDLIYEVELVSVEASP
jgi:FKBP-type peptidyl-prolyl cis-trans isomerase FklB